MEHIQQLQHLLTILLADRFSIRSLEDNEAIMRQLVDFQFQGIIFGRTQRYDNPNYNPTRLEQEFTDIENRLAQTIYDQFVELDLTNLTPKQMIGLHKDYESCCFHRDVNRDGKVWKSQSSIRKQLLIKAKEIKDKEQ